MFLIKKKTKIPPLYYFSESYKLSTFEGDLRDKFNGNYYLGKFLFQQNEIELAAPFLLEAKQIAEDVDNINILSVKDLADFYFQLSLYYQSINDYSNAYFYLKESVVYEAKRKITETNQELDLMKFKLEAEYAVKEKAKEKKSES